ncbi:MAG: hypothetical protein ACKVZJ_00495 [Phycisphaerales bacterium]
MTVAVLFFMAKKAPSARPLTRRTSFPLGQREVNRYDLYELCVQAPEMEAAFLRAVHGKSPRVLGEDFCGPASVARAWCASNEDASAVAIDNDPEPLEHAVARAVEHDDTHGLSISERIKFKEQDVLAAKDKADVIAALNFAVCELHKRRWLMTYLRSSLYRLRAGGVFVADLYGGPGAFELGVTDKAVPSEGGVLKYRWEQRRADPFSARVENAIHFVLPPGAGRGTEKARTFSDAFVYDWRLWGVSELREAMLEAGFARTEVYTSYGDAMDGEGNLYVRPFSTDEAEGDAAELEGDFVVYVAARA